MDEQRGTQKQIAKRYEDKVESRHTRSPWRRTRFWLSFIAIFGGLAAIYFAQKRTPPAFFNTGPLSRHHSALGQLREQLPHLDLQNDCVACHKPEATHDPAQFVQVIDERFRNGAPSFERIDQACQTCHQQHAFHAANVLENRSCSACHKEHQGPGPMQAATSLDCASCHNDYETMQRSALAGKQMPPSHFRVNPKVADLARPGAVTLQLPRPAEGYTQTFPSFSDGHPRFQLHRENFREADVLRFNHQLHLSGRGIPPTETGAKLDCNYCHKPEPNGRYMQRVSFEANCQSCHSLQFDVKNPDFQLPHGDAQLVRTFLRTLPAQYGELARRRRGMKNEDRISEFMTQQIKGLLTQFASGEEMERTVFFTRDPYKASQQADSATRAKYTGCAYCHEVTQAGGVSYAMPQVTAPVIIDRWMPHAHFNHARHATVASCRDCHGGAEASRLTSDVLMPTKENCTSCHRPAGVAMKASECMTCHTYHAPDPRLEGAKSAATGSFRQMLLGPGR